MRSFLLLRSVFKKTQRLIITGLIIGVGLVGAGYTSKQAHAATPPVAYSGSSESAFLDINALKIATLNVANLQVQPSTATANTAATPRTAADAHNLGGAVVGLNIGPLLLSAHSQAPPNGVSNNSLVSLGVNPLLTMNTMNVDTEANWSSDTTCVAGRLSRGATSVANLGVVDLGLLSLISAQTIATESQTSLVPTGGLGDERALESIASSSLESLTIAGVDISIEGTPTITAKASGKPGGALATYDAPAVTVGGEVLSLGQSITLDTVGLGLPGLTPQITVTLNSPTLNHATDGSQASGSVAVLSVRVYQPVALLPDIEILDLDLMPLEAEANLDGGVGGLQCAAPLSDLAANDDTFSIVEGGGVAGNVLGNDTQDSVPVDDNDIELTFQDPGATGIVISSDGTVSVPPTLAPGSYELPYEICEVAVPTHCDSATVTVEVTEAPDTAAAIVANDDFFTVNEGDTNIGSVTLNDTADGSPVDTHDFTATLTDNGGIVGASINADGNLVIPASTAHGTYSLQYKICQNEHTDNCDTAIITLLVRDTGDFEITPVIDANDDTFQVNKGASVAGNVMSNDTIDDQPMQASAVTLTSQPLEEGIEIDNTGDVQVAASTEAGNYELTYEVCDVDDSENCDTANVQVAVLDQNTQGGDSTGGNNSNNSGNENLPGAVAELASTGGSMLVVSLAASTALCFGVALWLYRRSKFSS